MERLDEHLAQVAAARIVQVDADVAYPIVDVRLAVTCLDAFDHVEIEQRARRAGAQRVARRGDLTPEIFGPRSGSPG